MARGGRRLCGAALQRVRHRPQCADGRPDDVGPQQAGQGQGRRQCGADEDETHPHLAAGGIDLRLGHADVVFDAFVEPVHALLDFDIETIAEQISRRLRLAIPKERGRVTNHHEQRVASGDRRLEELSLLFVVDEFRVLGAHRIRFLDGGIDRGSRRGPRLWVVQGVEHRATYAPCRDEILLDDAIKTDDRRDGIIRQHDHILVDVDHAPQAQAAEQERDQGERNEPDGDAAGNGPGVHRSS